MMAKVLPDWPDPVDILITLLTDELAGQVNKVVGPRLYAYFEKEMPVIRVRVVGGNDGDGITDNPRVAIDAYADTYPVSRDLAGAVRQLLLAYPHITTAGSIGKAETEVRPIEIPYADPDVRHFTATYRLSLRR